MTHLLSNCFILCNDYYNPFYLISRTERQPRTHYSVKEVGEYKKYAAALIVDRIYNQISKVFNQIRNHNQEQFTQTQFIHNSNLNSLYQVIF